MGKGKRTRAKREGERPGRSRALVGGPAPGLTARGFEVTGPDTPGAKLSVSEPAHAALLAAFGEEDTGATERDFAAWCEQNGHIYWWTGPEEDPTNGAWRLRHLPRSEQGFRTFEDPDDLEEDDLDDQVESRG